MDVTKESFYIGKELVVAKRFADETNNFSIYPGEKIIIAGFRNGAVEGCRVAYGFSQEHTFLLFNMEHVDSYLNHNFIPPQWIQKKN